MVDVQLYCFYVYSDRYHKNKVEQKPGWDANLLKWCLQEAKKANLKEQDYWGGFVLDEMKIQVSYNITKVRTTCRLGLNGLTWFNI